MRRGLETEGPIRVGLIGHGDAGQWIHGPLIEAAGDYRIVAVSTSRPASLALRRDEPRWAPDAGALAQAEDVDLVVVATPNHTHYRYAEAALQAGKAVLVDKPFVTDPRQALALIDLADRQGVCLSVFHNRRLDADYEVVRQMAASGRMGDLTLFEAHWDRPLSQAIAGWRALTMDGGGAHWDLGSHLVDQTLQLFGPDPEVRGTLRQGSDRAIAPDGFDLELRYGRLTCRLSAGLTTGPPRPRFRLTGSRGALTLAATEPWSQAIRRGRSPASPTFWEGIPAQAGELVVDGEQTLLDVGYPRWDQFYPRLAAALRSGVAPQVTAAQAARVVDILHGLEGAGQGLVFGPQGLRPVSSGSAA